QDRGGQGQGRHPRYGGDVALQRAPVRSEIETGTTSQFAGDLGHLRHRRWQLSDPPERPQGDGESTRESVFRLDQGLQVSSSWRDALRSTNRGALDPMRFAKRRAN